MNPEKLRGDFPALEETSSGRKIAYLDNAATTHKPVQVVERIREYYENENSNVGRSMHELAERSTETYSESRRNVADFISADKSELVFMKNTTDAMNYLADSLDLGDRVVISRGAHHSAQLPFRKAATRDNARVEYIGTENGIDPETASRKITGDTGAVVVDHVSNVTGRERPVEKLAEIAHENDALIAVDGAQSVPRKKIDVGELGIDFMAFSGHKMLGPMGSGGLYGRKDLLEEMEPSRTGGGMITRVTEDSASWRDSPERHEAGTPDVASAAGLAEAVKYLEEVGMDAVEEHERELVAYAKRELKEIEEVELHGARNGIISLNVRGVHPHDTAEVFQRESVAVRAGKHCAHPLIDAMGIDGTVRISPYLYNTQEEMKRAVEAVKKTVEAF